MKNRIVPSVVSWLMIVYCFAVNAQDRYRYTVNLETVTHDRLTIELLPPVIRQKEIVFYMPKIIPGTYRNADYGKFVHNFSAIDARGKALPVKQLSTNSWQIKNADKIYKIMYEVEDTWESELDHDVYDMAGTNFEEGKNFVLNTPGIFGYLDGMKKIPFELTINKPEGFYGATPLITRVSHPKQDQFLLDNADHLYDSPLMYSAPDTATVRLGKSIVLIASYSPRKLITASAIATLLTDMLKATESYLGGKLPVEKYAFIFYFNGEQPPLKRTGALEHNYSSFYALPELPFQQVASLLLDISAHEFFHIVTPLTISSREVKQFDFNTPVLSRHLWLYEGTTEYHSDHVQVVEGLIKPEEFLQKLAEKIRISRNTYDDRLPFTELSKESAGKYKDQYPNVYEKGALIAACLDVYLLQLSKGKYGLRNLKHDLGIRYGKDQYFEDDRLFDIITDWSFPPVRDFFRRYVEGAEPIPYEEFFGYAGVQFVAEKTPSLGGVQLAPTSEGKLKVADVSQMNALGKQIGYQTGDELVSLNGESIVLANAQMLLDNFKKTARERDRLEVVVRRNNTEIALHGEVITTAVYKLILNHAATPEQLRVRKAWLGMQDATVAVAKPVTAKPEDVSSIDKVIKTLYNVISGPAGPRNWDRLRSLFYPGAFMGAMVPTPDGIKFKRFTPEEYIKSNSPLFDKYGFYEKEISRIENRYGNIAQVFSTYAYTLDTPAPEKERGINSIELIYEGERWWITSINWNAEVQSDPIPRRYLGN